MWKYKFYPQLGWAPTSSEHGKKLIDSGDKTTILPSERPPVGVDNFPIKKKHDSTSSERVGDRLTILCTAVANSIKTQEGNIRQTHQFSIFTGLESGQKLRNLHWPGMVGLAMLAVLPVPGQYYITGYCSYWSEASFCKYQHWLLAFPASLKAAFFMRQNPVRSSPDPLSWLW